MPTPSVGRIVHYRSYGTPNGEYAPECRAAIITEVGDYPPGKENDEAAKANIAVPVGLAVLNPTGMFFNRGVMQSELGREGGTWHWPERV